MSHVPGNVSFSIKKILEGRAITRGEEISLPYVHLNLTYTRKEKKISYQNKLEGERRDDDEDVEDEKIF